MARSKSWRAGLVDDLDAMASTYGALPISAAELLDIELVLTLMVLHFPQEHPAYAWAALNGHHYPAITALSEEGRRAIAMVRLHLPRALTRSSWERSLRDYQTVRPPYPLYQIEGTTIRTTPGAILPGRRLAMEQALTVPPPRRQRPAKYAAQGQYQFVVDRVTHQVEIPGWVVDPDRIRSTEIQIPVNTGKRAELVIDLDDLEKTARWMDRHAPPNSAAHRRNGGWAGWIHDMQFHVLREHGLAESRQLTINGLYHLVGMVGSGKSTLFIILAVHLARKGLHVTMLMGDVATLLRIYAIFEVFRKVDAKVEALPLVGRSARRTHLNRLHMNRAAERGYPTLSDDHPAFGILSTVCPLDGLRANVDSPIPIGQEPCVRLLPIHEFGDRDEEDSGAAVATRDDRNTSMTTAQDCPLMPVCPVHATTRRLDKASIWLATSASLLVSGPQVPLIEESVRTIELVMRSSDIILVDEADAVQVQFDNYFARVETLIGRNESWLDRLGNLVARQLYQTGRPLIGRNATVDRWLTAHDNTQRAVGRLYRWLRKSAEIRHWLKAPNNFSGDRLLWQVETNIAQLNIVTTRFGEAREALNSTALGSVRVPARGTELPSAWVTAINLELSADDSPGAKAELTSWLTTTLDGAADINARQIESIAEQLLVALIVGVLDQSIQDMIADWEGAARELELDRGSGGLFYQPSESLVRLIPEAAMGSRIGFEYYDPENTGQGELRFFHIRGVGRYLLYHMHDALQMNQEIAGPHVILSSATSWAPGSWRYNLHAAPQAILMPPRSEHGAVDEESDDLTELRGPRITCFFTHLPDPEKQGRRLVVSGSESEAERQRSLRAMVAELARRPPRGKSLFDLEMDELAKLPGDRQRILLVVGSYADAAAVEDRLNAVLNAKPGEHVVSLIPNVEGENELGIRPGKLLLGNVHRFPETGARYLIAPLAAIQRGHNILQENNQSAIGSVYFLARAMPVPGDVHTAVQVLNAWALNYEFACQPLDVAASLFRNAARDAWSEELQRRYTYTGTEEQEPLLWTQLVLVWQCIGRLLRGGTDARVHFVDAKWAEASAGLSKEHTHDTVKTSMLLGFEHILDKAINSHDSQERALARALYGPFAEALKTTKGVYRAKH